MNSIDGTTSTNTIIDLAKAVNDPSNTVATDCRRGGTIKAIWISLDFCGLASTGAVQFHSAYMIKNPGANLVPPGVLAVGTSNEKKFVFKQWTQMTMLNTDGNPPYHWEGWVKIPKRYQRMGADDIIQYVIACNGATGHSTIQVIYKEYF